MICWVIYRSMLDFLVTGSCFFLHVAYWVFRDILKWYYVVMLLKAGTSRQNLVSN